MRSLISVALFVLILLADGYAQQGRAIPASTTITGRASAGDVVMVEYYPTLADHILDNRVRVGSVVGEDGSYRITFDLGHASSCALYLNNIWFAAVELMPGETLTVGDPEAGSGAESVPPSRIATLYGQAMEDFRRHPAFMDEEMEKRFLRISRVDSFLAASAANMAARDGFIREWAAAHTLSPDEAALLRSRFYLKPMYELRYFNGLQDGSGRTLDSAALRVLDRVHDIIASPSTPAADVDNWILIAELYLNHYAAQVKSPRPLLTEPLRTPRAIEQVSRILDGPARDAMLAKIVASGLADALGKRTADPGLHPDSLLAALKRYGRDTSLYTAASELVERHRTLLPGSMAPDLVLTERARRIHLSELRGKPVLLAFWTTTGDVTPDAPIQIGMLRSKVGPDVKIVSVHLGRDEKRWRSEIRNLPGGIFHLYDPAEWWDGIGRRWALPQPGYAVAIDAEGRIAMRGFELYDPATIEMFTKLAGQGKK